jgi:hypothetical protein
MATGSTYEISTQTTAQYSPFVDSQQTSKQQKPITAEKSPNITFRLFCHQANKRPIDSIPNSQKDSLQKFSDILKPTYNCE